MKYLKILMLPLLGLPFFTACNDDTAFDANADVFIMSRELNEGGTEFAPAYYVFANMGMKNVDVITPGGTAPIELEPLGGLTSTFALEPKDQDYHPTPPPYGAHTFNVLTNKNEEIQLSDILESNVILPTATLTAMVEDNKLTVDWDKVTNAEAYIVRMYNNEDGQLIFGTQFITDTTDITMLVSSIGQQGGVTPMPGKTYKIELQAYLFEEGITYDHGVNIQCVSIKQITWTWESED